MKGASKTHAPGKARARRAQDRPPDPLPVLTASITLIGGTIHATTQHATRTHSGSA